MRYTDLKQATKKTNSSTAYNKYFASFLPLKTCKRSFWKLSIKKIHFKLNFPASVRARVSASSRHAASKACRPSDGTASNLPHEPNGRVRQVTCCAGTRAGKLLVALLIWYIKDLQLSKNVDSRNFDNLPITIKMKKLFENIAVTFTFVFLFR